MMFKSTICIFLLLGLSHPLTCQVFHTSTNVAVVNEHVHGVFYFNKNECEEQGCLYQIGICDKDGNVIASQNYVKEDLGLEFSFQLKTKYKTGLYFLTCSPYKSNEVYGLKPIIILNPEEEYHLDALNDDLIYQSTVPEKPPLKVITTGSYLIDYPEQSTVKKYHAISITDLSQSPLLRMEAKEPVTTIGQPPKSFKISGQITAARLPLKNTLISMNSTNDSLDFKYTITDDFGHFQFPDLSYSGIRTFVLNHFSVSRVKAIDVRIDSLQKLNIPEVKVYADSLAIKEAVRLKLLSDKVDLTFQEPTKKPIWSIEESKPLIKYNHLIIMEDYVAFPTMTRVIKEIVPFVKTKDSTLNVFSTEINRTLPSKPLIFIDGVISTPKEVLMLDVSSVKFIEVINNRKELARYGRLGHGGVVSVVRKEMHAGTFKETRPVQNIFKYAGLSKPSIFKQKEKTESKPYFPSTLVWRTDETNEIEQELNFTLPDYSTRLLVTLVFQQSDGSIHINQEILHFEK